MSTPYHIKLYIPAEIEAEYPNLWATINKYFPDLPEDKQAIIGSIVMGTCHSCHNANKDCQCWNDE